MNVALGGGSIGTFALIGYLVPTCALRNCKNLKEMKECYVCVCAI